MVPKLPLSASARARLGNWCIARFSKPTQDVCHVLVSDVFESFEQSGFTFGIAPGALRGPDVMLDFCRTHLAKWRCHFEGILQ